MCVRVWEGREQGRMESARYNQVQFFPDLLSSSSKCYQYLSCWCFLSISFISDFWLIAYCSNKKRSTNAQQRQSMLFFRCFFHQGMCVVKNQLGYLCLLSDEESWRLFIAWNPEIEKCFVHCWSWPIRWYLCVSSVVGGQLNSAVLGNLLIEEMNWARWFVLILKTTQQSSVCYRSGRALLCAGAEEHAEHSPSALTMQEPRTRNWIMWLIGTKLRTECLPRQSGCREAAGRFSSHSCAMQNWWKQNCVIPGAESRQGGWGSSSVCPRQHSVPVDAVEKQLWMCMSAGLLATSQKTSWCHFQISSSCRALLPWLHGAGCCGCCFGGCSLLGICRGMCPN